MSHLDVFQMDDGKWYVGRVGSGFRAGQYGPFRELRDAERLYERLRAEEYRRLDQEKEASKGES